ncbi:MAG: synthase subunit, partial [Clostridia bacterium]|nr:synthase subunit [Clostridia bacterium]
MDYVLMLTLLLMTMIPLYFAFKRAKQGKKYKFAIASNIFLFFAVIISTVVLIPLMSNAAEVIPAAEDAAAAANSGIAVGLGYLAAALSTGLSCVGAGIAVASAASSAIGATSENPKM